MLEMKIVDLNQEIHMGIHEVGISMADSTKLGANRRAQAGNGRRDFDD